MNFQFPIINYQTKKTNSYSRLKAKPACRPASPKLQRGEQAGASRRYPIIRRRSGLLEELVFCSIGQSLIELMIAVAVGTITIISALGLLTLTLRVGNQDISFQTGAFLGQRVLDEVTVMVESDWLEIAGAMQGNQYHVDKTGGVFARANNADSQTIDNVVYSFYFTVAPVSRNSGGAIEDPYNAVNDDKSTKKIEATVSWLYQGNSSAIAVAKFVTRSRNVVINQTDWSGGATGASDPIFTKATNTYKSSSGDLDFSGGLIKIADLQTDSVAAGKPDYLETVADPDYGYGVTRITDDGGNNFTTGQSTGSNTNLTWGPVVRHRYVADPLWNVDGSLIMAQSTDPTNIYHLQPGYNRSKWWLLMNGQSYLPIREEAGMNANWRWSQNLATPTVIYEFYSSTNIRKVDVNNTYNRTTGVGLTLIGLSGFNNLTISGKDAPAFVSGSEYMAVFDDRISLSEGIKIKIIKIEEPLATVIAEFSAGGAPGDSGPCSSVDTGSLRYSSDGNYLLYLCDGSPDSWRILDVNLGTGTITAHDTLAGSGVPQDCSPCLPAGADRTLGFFPLVWGHPVFAYATNGDVYVVGRTGSLVGSGWFANQILDGSGQKLDDGVLETPNEPDDRVGNAAAFNAATNKFKSLTDPDNGAVINDEATTSHFTATNYNNKGYVFVSYDGTSQVTGSKYFGEIVRIKFDSSPAVVTPLAAHNTNNDWTGLSGDNCPGNDFRCFKREPHVNASPDGKRVAFPSTWGTDQDEVNDYVVQTGL